MSSRYSDYRAHSRRTTRPRRDAQRSDAIVAAITAQILVCMLLLGAGSVFRQMNADSYMQFRTQYLEQVTSIESTQSGQGLLSPLADAVEYLVGRLAGNVQTVPPEVTAGTESRLSEPQLPEYDYLDPPAAESGAGGWFPVDLEADQVQFAAPAGSTLAPTYLMGRMITPVEGIVTSPFAYREHPLTGNTDFHNGIDIAAEEGRGILAALPGTVVEIGQDDIYGNYIVLEHTQNLRTTYSHCSMIIAAEGMVVRQGERIAKVGQTGLVTGPHLHFSVVVEEEYTDPMWVLGDSIQLVD